MECMACGFRMIPWGKVGNFQISTCPNCGLGKTDNTVAQKTNYHRDIVYQQEGAQFKNIFLRRVNLIESLNLEKGKVLEIGSSTGLLLSILKGRGWEVAGIEISPEAAKYAEERGISTIKTPIEKITLPKNSFDVIIINHTLEHLGDPIKVLQKIHYLLKDNGILLLDVPNFGGVSAKIFKTSWFALLPSEHLWHFTPLALSKLLHPLGFKIIRQESVSGVFDYGNPLLEIVQSLIMMKKRFFSNIFTLIPNFVTTKLNRGATITILARKI